VFFLGLRKVDGISRTQFERIFGVTIEELYPGVVDSLTAAGLATATPEHFALTERGLMLTDSVLEQFATPDSAAVKELVRLQQMAQLKRAAHG
jgi:coproporphyrinogen III oxidase-like Fe-S oxidoreductase